MPIIVVHGQLQPQQAELQVKLANSALVELYQMTVGRVVTAASQLGAFRLS